MTPRGISTCERREFIGTIGAGMAALALAGLSSRALAQTSGGAASLKIGMIGAGREGGALGALFVKAGHPVKFSSRNPDNLKDLVAGLGPLASAGTVAEAVTFGDVVVVVIPYAAVEAIGKAHGAALASKVLVLDVSNPIPRRDGEDFVKSVNDQGGPGVVSAKWLQGAKIVRAFNAIGSSRLPQIANRQGDKVGVPIAGDDPKAIATAESLIREIGFEPVLVGGLAMGKYLLPGTPLAEEHTPEEIRKIAAGLK